MVIGESDTSFIYQSSELLPLDFSNCTVSLATDEFSVSFGVFDTFSTQTLHLERHSLLDRELDVLELPFLSQDVGKLIITQKGGSSTMVPNALAQGTHSNEIQDFLNESKAVYSSKLNNPEAVVYYNRLEIVDWLNGQFPQALVQHNSKPLIENILNSNRYQKGMKIYADINERSAELIVIRDNQLIKYTSENFQTSADLLYHLTALIEIHGFNQLEDFLFLSGLIDNRSNIYNQIKRFVKNVRLNAGLSYQKISSGLGVVPKHQFFTVINAYQCA